MNKTIWFKRKKYGWGWTPANAKGWLATLIYVLMLGTYSILSELGYFAFSTTTFILVAIPITIGFIGLCYLKGENPKWHWGK